MNIRDAKTIISQINTSRSRYGFGPVLAVDEQAAVESERCHEISLLWIRSGFGSGREFRAMLPEIKALFDCDIEYRRGRIHLCRIVDTWTLDFGMDADDFERLASEIEVWISVNSPRGRQ